MGTLSLIFIIFALGMILAWGVPWFSIWRSTRVARKRLERHQEPAFVLYRLNRFITYFHTLYFLVFLLASYYWAAILTRFLAPYWWQMLVLLFLIAVSYIILRAGYGLITFGVMKQLIQFQDSRWSRLWRSVRRHAAVSGGYALFYFVLSLDPEWTNSHPYLSSLVVMGMILVVTLLFTELAPLLMRTKRIPDSELPDSWRQRVMEAGLNEVQFYLWKTRKSKTANAMATGFFRRKVIVADYLMDISTDTAMEATIAHELGHLRKRHLWWSLLVMEAFIPLVVYLYTVLQTRHISALVIIFAQVLFVFAYQGLLMKWLSRSFEYQADGFSVNLMGSPTSMSAALDTLGNDGLSLREIPWFDELWMTHPSIGKRIRRVEHKFAVQKNTSPSEA